MGNRSLLNGPSKILEATRHMRFPVRATSILALSLATAFATTGCKRQRAENSLKKTQQKLSEISLAYNGMEHEPDRITGIQQTVDSANQSLEADASRALELAKQASSQADQLLEQVKPKHAQSLFSQAEEEIQVADINDLPRREPTRYQRIRDLKSQTDAAKLENEYDDVILLSQQIIAEVSAGLATLKHDSERAQMDAVLALTSLIKIGGNQYAPDKVIEVRTDIDLASQIATNDRDFVLAANRFSEAKNKSEQGIIQVLREKSREAIEEIEGYLSEALIEGAKQFQNDTYQDVNDQFEQVLVNYKEGRYHAVIEASNLLKDSSQALVLETKRSAPDDRLVTMQANINELDLGGISEYLPNSLEKLRVLLSESQDLRENDDEPSFDKIKDTSIDAAEEYDRQREAFQTLAVTAIRNAGNKRDTSLAVFNEMGNIFEPLEAEMTSEQVAFENQKKTREIELKKRLDEAESNLGNANILKNQGDFRGSIILALNVENDATDILAEIYHTVGHNASIELARLISRYVNEGADLYAPEELERSMEKLEEVKALIASGEYKDSVQRAAETRADVELMAQRIGRRATEEIRQARKALESANSNITRKYRPDELIIVEGLIDQAEQFLREDQLKQALNTADIAKESANTAEREAFRLAARDQLAQTMKVIAQAEEAGAEKYAGADLEEAKRLHSQALRLSQSRGDSREFAKAIDLGVSSYNRANSALYKHVNEAESSIASAKAVGGWDYDHRSLGEASAKVRQSRAKLEQKAYSESHSLAGSAQDMADSLVIRTKRNNFRDRVSNIRKNLQDGTHQGINFFQPEESKDIRVRVAALENEYSSDNYERIMKEVEIVEAFLRDTLDKTDLLVSDVETQLDGRIDQLVKDGAVTYASQDLAEARQSLKAARLDYRRGFYKAAHSNLNRSIGLVDRIESQQAELQYSHSIQGLFDEYLQIQISFKNILSLDPGELQQLAIDTDGRSRAVAISAQVTPNQFRKKLDELYSRAVLMGVPENMKKVHQTVILAFAEGRLGAINFEKLVLLNRVAVQDATLLINEAYLHVNRSNELIEKIQGKLITDEQSFSIVANPAMVVNSIN
jgi:hypothetical protein